MDTLNSITLRGTAVEWSHITENSVLWVLILSDEQMEMCLHNSVLSLQVASRVLGHKYCVYDHLNNFWLMYPLVESNISGDLNDVWGPLLKGHADYSFLQIIYHTSLSHTVSKRPRRGCCTAPKACKLSFIELLIYWKPSTSVGVHMDQALGSFFFLLKSNAEGVMSFPRVVLGKFLSSPRKSVLLLNDGSVPHRSWELWI